MSSSKHQSGTTEGNLKNRIDRRRLMQGATAAGAAGLFASTGMSLAVAQDSDDPSERLLRIGGGQAASWVKNFNPLVPDALPSAQYGIHEPLFVYSSTKDEITPWLATEWAFNEDNTVLTFKIREGVAWSDGTPFSATDVAFTMNLLKENTALSGSGGIRGVLDSVTSFEAPDATTFVATFTEVFTPGIYLLGAQAIVPEHIWIDVDDPVTFANETPVGTGPFTEIGEFRPQYYELLKDPNYWQDGKPYVAGLAYPSYGSNDAGTLGLINDDFDWMGLFIPDIENTLVSEDPEHYHYWFPLLSGVVSLFYNHAKPPFDNVAVRKAISMAIDRQQINDIAVYGYSEPADATGMSNLYANWKSDEVIEAGKELVSRNVDKANQLLDEAGFARDGDVRKTPDGEAMEFELIIPSGWSDWAQASQLLSQQVAEIGVKVNPRGVEVTTWYDSTYQGNFELSLGGTADTATPYDHFQNLMSTELVKPVGEVATTNWHRYGNEQATELIANFAATSDETTQLEIAHQLQQIFLEEWPVAPMHPGPRWAEWNTLHFEGFSTEDDPYANPGPDQVAEKLLVFTHVKPKA